MEEGTFLLRRQLEAARQSHLATSARLEEELQRVAELERRLETEETATQTEERLRAACRQVEQGEEVEGCLREELERVRGRDGGSEGEVASLRHQLEAGEEEQRRMREQEPEPEVARLQEELAASRLREEEGALALQDLRTKVGELGAMWGRHLRTGEEGRPEGQQVSSPPCLQPGEQAGLEQELLSSRLREVETLAEIKQLRLRDLELESKVITFSLLLLFLQVQVVEAQVQRRDGEVLALQVQVEEGAGREAVLEDQLVEARARGLEVVTQLEEVRTRGRVVSAVQVERREKVREEERRLVVAELAQRVGGLEYQVGGGGWGQESVPQKEGLGAEREAKVAELGSLRHQVRRVARWRAGPGDPQVALVMEPLPDKRKTSLNVVPQSL